MLPSTLVTSTGLNRQGLRVVVLKPGYCMVCSNTLPGAPCCHAGDLSLGWWLVDPVHADSSMCYRCAASLSPRVQSVCFGARWGCLNQPSSTHTTPTGWNINMLRVFPNFCSLFHGQINNCNVLCLRLYLICMWWWILKQMAKHCHTPCSWPTYPYF